MKTPIYFSLFFNFFIFFIFFSLSHFILNSYSTKYLALFQPPQGKQMASSHANSTGTFNAERYGELKPFFIPSAGESAKLIVELSQYNINSKINFRE